ncbi:hypothetical protein DN069_38345 [Streptacidiphilus pinicola]|uniref:PKD domain-containing protein n=1 Tax=Streptacidiphilus pinicola TaxID=2219663 RepID=A0A2X0JZD8_9ACTN|nr:right-handed parallel beta-helix repeat-containing protein [Streptacidiphilus pinicola]RAG80400.1 hypothetical protein DN069_38345 [Streptacidiphilus pinicola]
MPHHRRTVSTLTSALLVGVALPLATSTTVHADTGSTIYVSQAPMLPACSDTAPDAGSQATPFCSLQLAVDKSQPGQTVQVDFGQYGPLTIHHSGAPGLPITISNASGDWTSRYPIVKGVTLAGVHDITLKGLNIGTAGSAVTVTDSSDITLAGNRVFDQHSVLGALDTGVAVSGSSSAVTVLHNSINGFGQAAVSVGTGASGTTVAGNLVVGDGQGVVVTGAPHTLVSGNTFTGECAGAVALSGGSTGSVVEDDIAFHDGASYANAVTGSPCRQGAGTPEIQVSADSAAGTTLNYNDVLGQGTSQPYLWAGQPHATAADLYTSVGQGQQDLNLDPQLSPSGYVPAFNSPVVDSANADAPGEPATGLHGQPRVDVPGTPDTGTGANTYTDRGAVEAQDPFTLNDLSTPSVEVPLGTAQTFTADVTNPWSTGPVQYSFSVDNVPTVLQQSTSPTFTHTFDSLGGHSVQVTATLPNGATRTAYRGVDANPPGPLAVSAQSMHLGVNGPLVALVDFHIDTPWTITGATVDLGDGHGPFTVPAGSLSSTLQYSGIYAKPGTYPVSAVVTDAGGRTSTAHGLVTVGGVYTPLPPARILATWAGVGSAKGALSVGQTLRLKVTGNGGVPNSAGTPVTAVTLNLTASGATGDGYVTAYGDGSPPPTTDNLTVSASHTTQNQVTVPVSTDGYIDLYNHAAGTQLSADVQGYYTTAGGPGTNTFSTAGPIRLLDTWSGTNVPKRKIGPGGTLTFNVFAAPARLGPDTKAVLLNLTATDATAPSAVTAYKGGTTTPYEASLHAVPGQTVSNLVAVPVASNGTVTLQNASGYVDLTVDLQGVFDNEETGEMVSLPAQRALDTRHGIGAPQAQVGPYGVVKLKVAGVDGIPASAYAVIVNLTALKATQGSYVTAYTSGLPRPSTANVYVGPGRDATDLAVVPIGTDGCVDLFNRAGNVDLLADIQGFFG